MFSNVENAMIIYASVSLGFILSTLISYHKEKPWYTWTDHYSLRAAYLLGFAMVVVMVFLGWWYLAGSAIYRAIRALVKRETVWIKHQ